MTFCYTLLAIDVWLSGLILSSFDHRLDSASLTTPLQKQKQNGRRLETSHGRRHGRGIDHRNANVDRNDHAENNPRLPDILLIGAQKAGSTSLANWLFHCGICSPRVFDDEPKFYRKEVHYFDDDGRYEQGTSFYAQRFAHCGPSTSSTGTSTGSSEHLAMDATPATMLYADRVRRTYEEWDGGSMVDRVKILVVLREPSARELSWYNHVTYKCRSGVDDSGRNYTHSHCYNYGRSISSYSEYVNQVTLKSLDVATTKRSDLCRGYYAYLLKEWIQQFDRRQILILGYDEMVQNDEALAQRVQSFLGLDPLQSPGRIESRNAKENEYKVRQASCDMQHQLDSVFGPLNEALYELLENNPGPDMEQRPFPRFMSPDCTEVSVSVS